MVRPCPDPVLPPGSDEIAAWARRARLAYEPHPAEAWFAAWEPYDTMISASAYFNSVSRTIPHGSLTVAEPWCAPLGSEPMARTLLGFVSHAGFRRHAAARGGEHFNTRVAYVETPPAPRVQIGDPSWDRHMLTFAASSSEAMAAFPAAARSKLAAWGFVGHIEVRPSGLVLNFAGFLPTAADYERLLYGLPGLVQAFLGTS